MSLIEKQNAFNSKTNRVERALLRIERTEACQEIEKYTHEIRHMFRHRSGMLPSCHQFLLPYKLGEQRHFNDREEALSLSQLPSTKTEEGRTADAKAPKDKSGRN